MTKINYSDFENDKNKKVTIESELHDGEKIVSSFAPKNSAYISEKMSILSILFILWWGIFCVTIVFTAYSSIKEDNFALLGWVALIFGAILFVLVVFLIKIIVKARKEVQCIKYYITSERVIMIEGEVAFVSGEVYLQDISKLKLVATKRDERFKVSDLCITGQNGSIVLIDLEDAQSVKDEINKAISDLQKESSIDYRICEYCGSRLKITFDKCPYCGASVSLKPNK